MTSRRKKGGLIVSGIGASLYIFQGSIFLLLLSPTPVILSVSLLFTGAISLLGMVIGINGIKVGGAITLISIPISIIYMIILNFFLESITNTLSIDIIRIVFYPIPFPSSLLIFVGGILCIMSFDDD